ncbi:MAG: nucleotidyltransferase domain-containing protein [Syntrophaceae bacterium]|nr:nucleotidyltransferase domain-containing protein [Syntrophaceae bacterium]
MEEEIIHLISTRGPLTGSELKKSIPGDHLLLWQTCKTSSRLQIKSVGVRYLRFDRQVNGFARLSPSILREFLTYSVVGLAEKPTLIEKRAEEIFSHVVQVSRSKRKLASHLVEEVKALLREIWPDEQICFILAGDIVYEMAHDVPRPERSTGRLVRGSDIDLVVIMDDHVPDDFISKLDRTIYQEKYKYLKAPSINEEVDYVVKKMERVREQVRFNTFKNMVACKILQEGKFIDGSESLYREVMRLLKDSGVLEKLDRLQEAAIAFRKQEEEFLTQTDAKIINRENLYFFYPAEESEEFE